MRRHALRSLLLVGALAALSVPVFNMVQPAAACSQPGGSCVVTVSLGSGTFDSFISPLTVTSVSSSIAIERQVTGQTGTFPETITVGSGTVGFSILDLRGNNQGYMASIWSPGFTSSLLNTAFPLFTPGQLVVTGAAHVANFCAVNAPLGCGPVMATGNTGLVPLVAPGIAVAAECPIENIGESLATVSVPVTLQFTGVTAEKVASLPMSLVGSVNLTVDETPIAPSAAPAGCPPFSTNGGGTVH